MSEGDGMAEVTEGDREKAMEVMGWSPLTYESFRVAADEGNQDDLDAIETVDAVAAALAEERQKARAPYEAALQRWETGDDVTRMWLAREFRELLDADRG